MNINVPSSGMDLGRWGLEQVATMVPSAASYKEAKVSVAYLITDSAGDYIQVDFG